MRKNLKITAFLPLLITCFLLTGCFSTWSGNEGNFTLTFGSSAAGSRAAFLTDDEVNQLTHIVLLHNGPGPDQTRIIPPGTRTTSFSVIPGHWTITVEAYLELNENLEGDLTAWGETTANIKSGKNEAITIQMGSPPPPPPEGETFTVTFDLNYGEEAARTWDTVSVTRGKTASPYATPTRDNFGFMGWYTDAACNNPFNLDTPITADITLYAGWSNDFVIVIFHSMYGTFEGHTEDKYDLRVARNFPVPQPTPAISRDGFELDGWYTDENCTIPFDFDTLIAAETHLFAKWKRVLEITVSPPAGTLSPIDTVDFSVTVSGFENEDDAKTVELDIADVGSLEFKVTDFGFDDQNKEKTFIVKVTYDGDATFSGGSATITIEEITGIPSTYCLPENWDNTIAIDVTDGREKGNPIFVTSDNIARFNAYANTANGRARHYILTDSFSLGSFEWDPIGTASYPFTGSFDGDGNGISALVITDKPDYAGMFGYIGSGGVVKDLNLVGGSITNATTTGEGYAGGIAGRNAGIISGCSTTGSVTATGTNGYAGGIVGQNQGQVQNCYATGIVNGKRAGGVVGNNSGASAQAKAQVQNCYATGIVTATNDSTTASAYAGGVVGYNSSGTVQFCYATGNVTATSIPSPHAGGVVGYNTTSSSTVQNCYATGNVTANSTGSTGTGYAGGVVGDNYGGTVENCYATEGIVSGPNNVGGVAGSNSGTVQFCYATGDITTTGTGAYAGGVVGNNSGTVENSVALNLDISGPSTNYFGRITGGGGTTASGLANNYGRADMQKNGDIDATTWNPIATTSKNGGQLMGTGISDPRNEDNTYPEYNDRSFWNRATGVSWSDAWDFTNVVENSYGLPILNGFPATQTVPTVPQ